jgi:DNA-binding CsgD family transcriptional regulator
VLAAEQEAEIVRRCLAGERHQALAAEFGCASSFVDYLVRHRRSELTAREFEVLRLLATSASPAQIAVQLHLTAQTVRMCASRVYHKLDVRNRAEAVSKAVELHLIEEAS